jgi:hypothetical protein
VEFEDGDFVWVILSKDRFLMEEYNKLVTRKIEPLEIIEKIDSNLTLPSHIKTSNVFNVKYLVPFTRDSSNEDVNLRTNFSLTWEEL